MRFGKRGRHGAGSRQFRALPPSLRVPPVEPRELCQRRAGAFAAPNGVIADKHSDLADQVGSRRAPFFYSDLLLRLKIRRSGLDCDCSRYSRQPRRNDPTHLMVEACCNGSAAIVDMVGITRHGDRVIRFVVILLSSLSLLLSPAAAAAGAMESGPAQRECSMVGADPGLTADHEKMGCCKPPCTPPAAAAVLPSSDLGPGDLADAGPLLLFAGDPMLPSVSPGALDPPPRLPLA